MFIGAYPEQEVNPFVDLLLPTRGGARGRGGGQEEAEAGDLDGAEQGYREALAKDPANREAAIGLGRILVERGDLDEARDARGAVPARSRGRAPARDGRGSADGATRRGRDAGVGEAARRRGALARGARRDDGRAAGRPRRGRAAMRDVFAVLGDEDPLVPEYRRKLSNALF